MTFTKPTGLIEKLRTFIDSNKADTHLFLESLCQRQQPLLLRTEINDIFHELIIEKNLSAVLVADGERRIGRQAVPNVRVLPNGKEDAAVRVSQIHARLGDGGIVPEKAGSDYPLLGAAFDPER